MAEHEFKIDIVDEEMRKKGITGFQLQHLVLFPGANEPTFPCDCGAKIAVPHGSIAKFVAILTKTHSPTTMATIRTIHKYGSGDPEREKAQLEKLSEISDHTIIDTTGELKGYVKNP